MVVCMTSGSPACSPQAMLAEEMNGMTAASSPRLYWPKLSPISQLRSIFIFIAHNRRFQFAHHLTIFLLSRLDGGLPKTDLIPARFALSQQRQVCADHGRDLRIPAGCCTISYNHHGLP